MAKFTTTEYGGSARSYSVTDTTYVPRTTAPDISNPYYLQRGHGGYNPCILGNNANGIRPTAYSVIPNCVGYAVGRFNEIGGYGSCKYLGSTNAENFIQNYVVNGQLSYARNPSLGAVIVWRKGAVGNGNDGCGHVAIVEEIIDSSTIMISESGWSAGTAFAYRKCRNISGDVYGWLDSWMSANSGYECIGFIINPASSFNALADSYTGSFGGGSIGGGSFGGGRVGGGYVKYDYLPSSLISTAQNIKRAIDTGSVFNDTAFPQFNTKNTTSNTKSNQDTAPAGTGTVYKYEKEVVGSVGDIHGMQLLTVPTLVESPFIEVKIGDYTFGSYTKEGSVERANSTARVNYPNYMESLRITKINGAVNQYTLVMNYQIQAGDDPNLIDKIFSSVSDSRKITLTYGDWNAPSFIYKNEEAIITKVVSNVDFQQSRIQYTVYCTSSSLSLKAKTYKFGAYSNTKPSTVIRNLISNNTYGLLDIFYGMKNVNDVIKYDLIPSDDRAMDIAPQTDVDILTYLNYLVSCMTSNSSQNGTIKDAAYHLIMVDEVGGDLDGPYFKIVKVNTTSKSLTSLKAYEVDVGFPTNTMVMNFQINNDNSWAILYNYAESVNQEQYVYKIDNNGRLYSERSPNITTSNIYNQTTEAAKTWWTQMTQFPISATLTIKGLVRPAMLMEYVKINAIFYGQRHVSSGLYVITKQEDEVSRSGYKTTLSLLRVAGDEDTLYNIKQTEVKSSSSNSNTTTTKNPDTTNLAVVSAEKQKMLSRFSELMDSGAKSDNEEILKLSRSIGLPPAQVAYIVSQRGTPTLQPDKSVPTTPPPQTG